MLGFDKVEKLLNKNIIEVAPLAFMRGRTLNESFIILDEALNCTRYCKISFSCASRTNTKGAILVLNV
jgi:predicted ribonuclease YlaK